MINEALIGIQRNMKTPIVILHGWAKDMSGKKYDAIKKILESQGYRVYVPDLPGFGSNTVKKEELFFDDYVSFVYDYIATILKTTKEKKVILLGHSFGGRVAIRFTSLYPGKIKMLLLTGASGILRPLPSLKKKIVFALTKGVKPFFLVPPLSLFYKFFRKLVYYSIGEMDYYKAGSLTQTFKNVYKVSVADDLQKINVPTLIIWGEKDTITPLADGEYMHTHINNSKLVVMPDASHKLPYENPKKFTHAVLSFLS